jgi:hypothetical protein
MKATTSLMCLCVLAILHSAVAADNGKFPVNGTPKWYEVTGSGSTTSTVAQVHSVRTGELLGELPPKARLLSFGASSEYVTFAFNGRVAYVPLSAVTEMYPPPPTSGEFRSAGKTLEQIAQEYKTRAESSKNSPLAPNFTNMPTPRPTPGAVAGGSGMPGGRGAGGGDPASAGAAMK